MSEKYQAGNKGVIGPVTQSVSYMLQEGFFDNREIACTIWMTKMTDEVLERIVAFAESMRDGFPEHISNADCAMAILQMEQIKSESEEPIQLTADEAQKWFEKYAMNAILETGRRDGRFFADSLDLPLEAIRWADDPAKLK